MHIMQALVKGYRDFFRKPKEIPSAEMEILSQKTDMFLNFYVEKLFRNAFAAILRQIEKDS